MTNQDSVVDVEVIICCYTTKRWRDLCTGIQAALDQTYPVRRVVVVVDYNIDLHERVGAEFPDDRVLVTCNVHEQGLSGARNSGIECSDAAVVAFLDDDACPEPTWLAELMAPFTDPQVVVTGGFARPRWPQSRPAWFPPEFDWVVGCTYRGMPETSEVVRNVHGATMAFRRRVFDEVGGFIEGVGRVGTLPKGCEETELCIRISQQNSHARVVFVPTSVVLHSVSDDRVRPKYFFSRCWAEGLSKAAISRLIGATDATAAERSYVGVTLVRGVRQNLADAIRGNPGAAARAGMIAAGLAVTTGGYLAGLVSAAKPRSLLRSERVDRSG